MMRIFFAILLLSCFVACNSSSENNNTAVKDSVIVASKPDSELRYVHNFTDTILENRIIGKLMKLPFVKKSDKYIDSFTNHQRGIAFMVDSLQKGETEIFVRAGYNGAERFETYYQFYVDPKTLEIKVYDVVNDKKMTVKEYIKSQQ